MPAPRFTEEGLTTVPDARRIEPIEIEEEMQRSFLDYAMSVIVARALPDVRDGLKPVHRRILWGANEEGVRPPNGRRKSANEEASDGRH